MASIPITTIGVKISWAMEKTAGTRPTTGYKRLPDFTSTPDFNAEPDMLETTSFDNLVNKTYTPGLIDYGSTLEFGANLTQELYDGWKEFVEAYTTGSATGLAGWMCVDIPGLSFAYYLPCEPLALGLNAMEVNTVATTNVRVALLGDLVTDTAPTYADEE